MKKIAILIIFIFAVTAMTSCKSSKGCGLTGSTDTPVQNSIELNSIQDTDVA